MGPVCPGTAVVGVEGDFCWGDGTHGEVSFWYILEALFVGKGRYWSDNRMDDAYHVSIQLVFQVGFDKYGRE